MPEFPYIFNLSNLKAFIENISELGEPLKISKDYLISLGYTSSNDRPIRRIMLHIGFANSDGTPTDNYRQFRDKSQAGKVMARCLREAYAELFKTFPNACQKDDEALANFMRPYTKYSNDILGRSVRTFKLLCSFATFNGIQEEVEVDGGIKTVPKDKLKVVSEDYTKNGMTINLNIQLSLPATEEFEIYDKIFESLKKHLLDK